MENQAEILHDLWLFPQVEIQAKGIDTKGDRKEPPDTRLSKLLRTAGLGTYEEFVEARVGKMTNETFKKVNKLRFCAVRVVLDPLQSVLDAATSDGIKGAEWVNKATH